MSDLKDLDSSETKTMILSIENEIARYAMVSKKPETKQAVKNCIYLVLLRAIALSKDPNASVEEVKRLFELAKEITVNAELDDENDLQGRLDDLVNSMIDKSDISVQFKTFSTKLQEYFNLILTEIKHEKDLSNEDLQNIYEALSENRKTLRALNKKRSVFKMVITVLVTTLILAFAIFSTAAIMITILSKESNTIDGANLRSVPTEQTMRTKEPG